MRQKYIHQRQKFTLYLITKIFKVTYGLKDTRSKKERRIYGIDLIAKSCSETELVTILYHFCI